MNSDGYIFATDCVTKFHRSIFVAGWFHHPSDKLVSADIVGHDIYACHSMVDLPHLGVASLGANKGFQCQVLRHSDKFSNDIEITFRTENGWVKSVKLADLARDRQERDPSGLLMLEFKKMVAKIDRPRIIDVGGRFGRGFDRSKEFPGTDFVVFDILSGPNVDVVGDAHQLSAHFPAASFDAALSVVVFEHLFMPWKVVLEMNRIMKIGAVGMVVAPQTCGLHELPWDFFRFSETAWDALFNRATGFEILGRAISREMFVLPFVYDDFFAEAEKTAGFGDSAVLFRKVSETSLSWDVDLRDVIETSYPPLS